MRHSSWVIVALLFLNAFPEISSASPGDSKRRFALMKSDARGENDAARSRETHPGLKKRVAVMDMALTATTLSSSSPGTVSESTSIQIPPPADFALGLTEMLTTELMSSGEFIVLERKGLSDITAEQDLGSSDRANAQTAIKGGSIIGAQALIRCAVTEYAYTQSGTSGQLKILDGVSLGASVVRAQVGIDVRIYDAATSQVLASYVARGSAATRGVDFKYSNNKADVGGSGFSTTPLGRASREAIGKAVAFIARELGGSPWEARVIRASGGQVYLNAGAEAGVAVGTKFVVYRADEPLIDPASGLNLGSPEQQVGNLEIISVQPKYAVARVTAGDAPQANDIVRPIR